MYTRCPGCHTIYQLDAVQLATASGVVRCGSCGKTFNSLSELFPRRPEEREEALAASGMPPLLEQPDMIQGELPINLSSTGQDPGKSDEPPVFSLVDDESEHTQDSFLAGSGEDTDLDPGSRPDFDSASDPAAAWAQDLPLESRASAGAARLAWPLISAALALLLLVQLGFGGPSGKTPLARLLHPGSSLAHNPDPNSVIEVVSRDLHPHPGLDDAIILSASIRNQSNHIVPYPTLEVRFFDASQQVLGVGHARPEDYLHDAEAVRLGLAPAIIVPMLLEFIIEGGEPTGFQIRFHSGNPGSGQA